MDTLGRSLILISNPGSASRKYALYRDDDLVASFHFEFEKNRVICTIKQGNGKKKTIKTPEKDFNLVIPYLVKLLYQTKILSPKNELDAIGIRIVAPSDFFTGSHLVNGVVLKELALLKGSAPLHIGTALDEIRELKKMFGETPMIAVSDSEFHRGRPEKSIYYGFDKTMADSFGIKRYGYHGLSIESAVHKLRKDKISTKLDRVIIAHLGSGSSITALKNWKSVDTSMGYSPLEGLMSSTRSGSVDLSAAFAIAKHHKLDNAELEEFLNKESGLLGVSGSSDDIRILQEFSAKGNERAKFALELMIYKMAQEIGKMSVANGGIDAIVFTGTVGERSYFVRRKIMEYLDFLGFQIDTKKSREAEFDEKHRVIDVSVKKSKPILVVATDENRQIVNKVLDFIS